MSKTVLITGGAGFIGSHLADALLAEGHAVRVLDDLSTGFERNIARHVGKLEFIRGDVADKDVVSAACRDIEYVLHHAAVASVPKSLHNPFETQRAGEVATLALLDACIKRKVRRVILAASSSAYGGCTHIPASEDLAPVPLSPYAASKLACEHYLRAFVSCHDLEGVAFRYFNVFGPRQDPNSPYSAVISIFLNRMRKGECPHINGDGESSRDFTYVENVVHANLLAIRAPQPLKGVVCNIGCGERITIKELVAALNAALGTSLEPTFGPFRPGDAPHSQADISRARELLGYEPRVRFPEGIAKLVKYTEGQ